MAPYHTSRFSIDIPTTDLLSFVFNRGTEESRSIPCYFDADIPSRNFSLEEGKLYAKRFGLGLQKHGLKPGDKVLLFSTNDLFFPVVFWGAIAGGFVFTGSSSNATPSELAFQIKNSEAQVVVASIDQVGQALRAAQEAGLPIDRVYAFANTEEHEARAKSMSIKPWRELWANEEEAKAWSWKSLSEKEVHETTAVINYSSGTTGLPKGVEISHFNLVANSCQQAARILMETGSRASKARQERLQSAGHRWLAQIPLFHAYGQTYFCATGPYVGAKTYIMSKFELERYLLYMDIYRINYMAQVPTIMVMLSKHPKSHLYNFNAVEQIICGSAPLAKDTVDTVQKRMIRDDVQVKQGYGMSESTTAATSFGPDEYDDGRSVGWLTSNMKGKIRKVEGRDFSQVKAQNVGEILLAGPNIMKGYYKNDEANKSSIVNEDGERWYCTGDIGYFDDDEKLYIVDRIKDLIKVKGLQVAPAEVEQTLLAHPGVADAAVIGYKTGNNEYPRAFVIRKEGEKVSAKELAEFIQSKLSKHKWLEGGVVFVDEIPRTGSGKILRRVLRDSDLNSQTWVLVVNVAKIFDAVVEPLM